LWRKMQGPQLGLVELFQCLHAKSFMEHLALVRRHRKVSA
jgi:hypothetical protein